MVRLREWNWKHYSLCLLMIMIGFVGRVPGVASAEVLIDDFSQYPAKKFPILPNERWRIFSFSNFDTQVYYIEQEGKNKFLRAVIDAGLERSKKAITLMKRVYKSKDSEGNLVFYTPQEMPILQWRWRVNVLPTGSDEGVENDEIQKSDSAAGVYAYFQKAGQGPRIIKFVWSENRKVGERLVSPASKEEFQAHLVVLKSGPQGLGEWHVEQVNLIKEFKKEFGDKKVPRLLGVGVLTDADSTDTQAAADYDDFKLLSN